MQISTAPLATAALEFFRWKLSGVPGNYLEIGSFNGSLVAQLARQYPEKTFYCVDPFMEDGNTTHMTGTPFGESIPGLESIFLAATRGLKNVVLFRETSKEFYSRVQPSFLATLNIGTVFIDGNHRFDHVVNDMYLALDLLAASSSPEAKCVLFDDCHTKDVGEALALFRRLLGPRIVDSLDLINGGSVGLTITQ